MILLFLSGVQAMIIECTLKPWELLGNLKLYQHTAVPTAFWSFLSGTYERHHKAWRYMKA